MRMKVSPMTANANALYSIRDSVFCLAFRAILKQDLQSVSYFFLAIIILFLPPENWVSLECASMVEESPLCSIYGNVSIDP